MVWYDYFKGWDLSFFTNPTYLIGICVLVIITVTILFVKREIIPTLGRVLYFSELELLLEELSVTEIKPKVIYTKDDKRFMRTPLTRAYNCKKGRKNITSWLGKKSTAYLFRPSTTPEGKAIKVGSFWEGIQTMLDSSLLEKLTLEVKEIFMESTLFVAVDLEEGYTPEGLPEMSEEKQYTEADRELAGLVGRRIREGMKKGEDWIRNAGLIAIGVALTFILQTMGILTTSGG